MAPPYGSSAIPKSPPTPQNITLPLFQRLLKLYPAVIRLAYRAKLEKKKGAKAGEVDEFLKLDEWRYKGLPDLLEERSRNGRWAGKTKGKGDGNEWGLEFGELEKLMGWKIKHGVFRPTLLPLIRSNDPPIVAELTSDAFNTLPSTLGPFRTANQNIEHLLKSMKIVSVLRGVGPATASLVLSVAFPVDVPFFGDEVFEWLCRGEGAEKRKLKYDVKEYKELWEGWVRLHARMAKEGGKSGSEVVFAHGLEKVAFVCEHWGVVGEAEKMAPEEESEEATDEAGLSTEKDSGVQEETTGAKPSSVKDTADKDAIKTNSKQSKGKVVDRTRKAPKDKSRGEDEGQRRSKRARK